MNGPTRRPMSVATNGPRSRPTTVPGAAVRPVDPAAIPPELLERYGTSGPRYTSYPTVPQFRPEFDEASILERWRATNDAGRGLSLYVHIPFCRSLCLYCGCYTRFGQAPATVSAYVDALLREADRHAAVVDPARPVEQYAMGGGTPTFLAPAEMRRLVEGLQARFRLAPAGERSIEIDPLTVDEAYLDLLVDLGFNRFSFGVQDLDPAVQRYVNREMAPEVVERALVHLHRRGHDAINLDLMYGLPGQTPESIAATIRRVVALQPSRIALFGYAHVPWVSPHQKALERRGLPLPEARMALFGTARAQLLEAGYAHVGMDHFARPEDELIRALEERTLTRNFMGYTTHRGLDLLGIGASSISSVGTTYAQNVKEIDQYIERGDGAAWIRALELSPEDEIRREIILDLFCNFHLDIGAVQARHGIDFAAHFAAEREALRPMAADGLVSVSASAIAVSPLGRFFIRNICMAFDEYLAGERRKGRYSRTI